VLDAGDPADDQPVVALSPALELARQVVLGNLDVGDAGVVVLGADSV